MDDPYIKSKKRGIRRKVSMLHKELRTPKYRQRIEKSFKTKKEILEEQLIKELKDE